jgi:hypothetical protein
MQEGFLDGKQIVDRLIIIPAHMVQEDQYVPSLPPTPSRITYS